MKSEADAVSKILNLLPSHGAFKLKRAKIHSVFGLRPGPRWLGELTTLPYPRDSLDDWGGDIHSAFLAP